MMRKYLLAFIISISAAVSPVFSQEIPDSPADSLVNAISDSLARVLSDSLCRAAGENLIAQADSLRTNYEFVQSLGLYRQALSLVTDTLKVSKIDSLELLKIEEKKMLAENGANMLEYVYVPSVVASHRFSLEDFFLYYPMPDKSWHPFPPQLDTLRPHPLEKALYMPAGADSVDFSVADEIFPILSEDGKSRWFSSASLYGIGGYDIYVSHWDEAENEWGIPENMGFPYSSPYDDFLYYNTADGRFTLFASNRDCQRDSVNVYVLEFDNLPVKDKVENVEQLREIMALKPSEKIEEKLSDPHADVPENADTRKYMEKMSEVRSLRDSIDFYSAALEGLRNKFAVSDDVEERTALTNEILRMEAEIPNFTSSLQKATDELQEIEMEFLFNGVVIDLEKIGAEADRVMVSKNIDYTFTRMNMGDSLQLAPKLVVTEEILPEE